MDQIAEFIERLTEFVRVHVPTDAVSSAMPAGFGALLIGIGVCVLGAKLARWFLTFGFVAAGVLIGVLASRHWNVPLPLSAIGGALVIGGIGYMSYRFIIGVFTALFLSSVAFSVLTQQMVLPHWLEFDRQYEQTAAVSVSATGHEFQLGPASDATADRWGPLREYSDSFKGYLNEQEPNIKNFAFLVVLGAGLVGFLMGIFLSRLTLILFTAMLGVSLVSSGVAVLGSGYGVDISATCRNQPMLTLASVAVCFCVSVLLQARLTGREPATKKPAADE